MNRTSSAVRNAAVRNAAVRNAALGIVEIMEMSYQSTWEYCTADSPLTENLLDRTVAEWDAMWGQVGR